MSAGDRARGPLVAGIDARTALEDKRRGWARYAEEILVALAAEPNLHLRVLTPESEAAEIAADRLHGAGNVEIFRTEVVPRTDYPHEGEWDVAPERWLGDVDLVHSLTRFLFPTRVRPVIATVHDVCPIADPPFKSFLRDDTLRALEILRRPGHHIIAVSDFTRQELRRGGIDPAVVEVVHLGANVEFHRAMELTEERRRSDVLFVGGAEPNKNLSVLVQAVDLARQQCDVRLLLAGSPAWGYEQALAGRSDPWIVRLGYLSDAELARAHRTALALVCPSLYEGFGLPVVEAMASGTPVVCSDIPVLREVAGEAALYFPPDSSHALASAILALQRDPLLSASLRAVGRCRAETMTFRSAASQTHALYRRWVDEVRRDRG